MTHFLNKGEVQDSFTGRSVAAVTVRYERRRGKRVLVVSPEDGKPPICLVKVGTRVSPVPKNVTVEGPDGEVILPSSRFWVTTETIDPYHLVTDVEQPW